MKMRKYRWDYFIKQGAAGLWNNRMMTLASVFILMFCLNILGAFALLIYNMNVNVEKLGDLNLISAFVESDGVFKDGEKITLPESVKAKEEGASFLGWSFHPDATVADLNAKGQYTVSASDSVSGVITLYAVWSDAGSAQGYPVLFSDAGTLIEGQMPTVSDRYDVGSEITLPIAPTARYMNISFLGWSTDPLAEQGIEAETPYVITEEDVRDEMIVFYAIWSENATDSEDEIVYDKNGCPVKAGTIEIIYDMNGKEIEGEVPTVESVRLATVEKAIKELDNVKNVELISKEQALAEELEKYKDYPGLIEDLLSGDNPYPDMFYISYEDNALVDDLQYGLSEIEGIYKVNCRSDYAENIESIKNGIILVFVGFLSIVFLFSILIIVNTVKLTVYSRRDEIGVMTYVGATHFFIAVPYVLQGIMIGLLSGIAAFITEKLLYDQVQSMMSTDFAMISVVPFDTFSTGLLVAFLFIGVFTGVLGSCISLRRYTDT